MRSRAVPASSLPRTHYTGRRGPHSTVFSTDGGASDRSGRRPLNGTPSNHLAPLVSAPVLRTPALPLPLSVPGPRKVLPTPFSSKGGRGRSGGRTGWAVCSPVGARFLEHCFSLCPPLASRQQFPGRGTREQHGDHRGGAEGWPGLKKRRDARAQFAGLLAHGRGPSGGYWEGAPPFIFICLVSWVLSLPRPFGGSPGSFFGPHQLLGTDHLSHSARECARARSPVRVWRAPHLGLPLRWANLSAPSL